MPEKIRNVEPPRGLSRILFRMPILLFRVGLGWLLGERFLMLTHIGRVSGLKRRAVLEVIRHAQESDTYFVASGWGTSSDWYRNILKHPGVSIAVGRRQFEANARLTPPEEAEEEMLDYARRHPTALRQLARMMGYKIGSGEEDIRALGRLIPVVALQNLDEG
jgi:deazaflavin-dependent oxidoreductase (nitroreductase family)